MAKHRERVRDEDSLFFDGRLRNYPGHCFGPLIADGSGIRSHGVSKTKSADKVNAFAGVAGDATVTNSGERTRHNAVRRDDVTLQRITRGEASCGPEEDHFLFPTGCGLALLRHEVFVHEFNGALGQISAGTQAEFPFDVFAMGLNRFHAQI